jgi:hypothetical protein
MLNYVSFIHGLAAPSGPGHAHCQGFIIALRHTALGRTPLDEWSTRQRTSNWQNTTLTRHKHWCPGGIRSMCLTSTKNCLQKWGATCVCRLSTEACWTRWRPQKGRSPRLGSVQRTWYQLLQSLYVFHSYNGQRIYATGDVKHWSQCRTIIRQPSVFVLRVEGVCVCVCVCVCLFI